MKILASFFLISIIRTSERRLVFSLNKRGRIMDARLTEERQGLCVYAEVFFVLGYHVGIGCKDIVKQFCSRTEAPIMHRVFFRPEDSGYTLLPTIADHLDQLIHSVLSICGIPVDQATPLIVVTKPAAFDNKKVRRVCFELLLPSLRIERYEIDFMPETLKRELIKDGSNLER
jgi:hypothetical protein